MGPTYDDAWKCITGSNEAGVELMVGPTTHCNQDNDGLGFQMGRRWKDGD